MKERPILFSAPMVRAILDGRKTMTRRIMKPQPDDDGKVTVGEIGTSRGVAYVGNSDSGGIVTRVTCPYGQPSNRLWVRETWRPHGDGALSECTGPGDIDFAADSDEFRRGMFRWRPSIFMPRWASRILLEITDVRVERLQEITHAEAIAEGVTRRGKHYCMDWSPVGKLSGVKDVSGKPALITEEYIANDNAVGAFAAYWESLNGDDSWAANPWVWVVEFKRLQP